MDFRVYAKMSRCQDHIYLLLNIVCSILCVDQWERIYVPQFLKIFPLFLDLNLEEKKQKLIKLEGRNFIFKFKQLTSLWNMDYPMQ